jgi:hypothetical protein
MTLMPNNPNMASLSTTQMTWMAILTATSTEDYQAANVLVNEFRLRYGDLLPLLICSASMCNGILDVYSDVIGEDPKVVLQSLAMNTLLKGENPNGEKP